MALCITRDKYLLRRRKGVRLRLWRWEAKGICFLGPSGHADDFTWWPGTGSLLPPWWTPGPRLLSPLLYPGPGSGLRCGRATLARGWGCWDLKRFWSLHYWDILNTRDDGKYSQSRTIPCDKVITIPTNAKTLHICSWDPSYLTLQHLL